MAHDFFKRTLDSPNRRTARLLALSAGAGVFLFANAHLLRLLHRDTELSSLVMLAAALLLGAPLAVNALGDLILRRVEMNELAALSYAASMSTARYDIAAVIALFMFISQLIEYRSEAAVRKSLLGLMRLAPATVTVKTPEGMRETEANSLRPGTLVFIRPGDGVPCDGEVVEGASWVDESTITGESMPCHKSAGAAVYRGTMNRSGSMTVKVTAPVHDSTLEKIRRLIGEAEEKRTPVVRLIDRYASWYTTSVLFIALAVLFAVGDIDRSISILVVACPCILLLAGPTALVAALSAAARVGVVVKDVSRLELLKKVSTVFFDKTGTLSTGKLGVCSIETFDSVGEQELLRFAFSLEQHSNHPIAAAVSRHGAGLGITPLPVEQFTETPGYGVSGVIAGRAVALGRREWVEQFGGDSALAPRRDAGGAKSRLYLACDKRLAGTIGLSDSVRPEAREVIEHLREAPPRHIRILTGDNRRAAEQLAAEVGCEVSAGLLPDQKLAEVRGSRAAGEVVAVVGDGINDGPALAASDVPIAMGLGGSDLAIESAAVVLMNDRLDRIPFLFELSTRLVRITQQNILLSITFILTMITLAAAGVVPPVWAVVLHTLAVAGVLANSGRLLRTGAYLQ